MIKTDEIGPEAVIQVFDHATGMRGVVVIDNTNLGPCGGGTRMLPDVSVEEVAGLARAMTAKFAVLGLPRGGSKAGLWGDSRMPAEQKKAVMRAFGKRLRPLLVANDVAVGPDMGVTVGDVSDIYEGAGVTNARSGLFGKPYEGDPAAYHITGYGVVQAIAAAAPLVGLELKGASVAIEGFGQVGTGAARYAAKLGAKVVAISTLRGAIYDPEGLDVEQLLRLRREVADDCILRYEGRARQIPSTEIYFLPVDVMVPGARPYVINDGTVDKVQAKLVVSAGNITVTETADLTLAKRGIVSVPDFIANSGGMIGSLVDFLAGDVEDAFRNMRKLIGGTTAEVVKAALANKVSPHVQAMRVVRERVLAARDRPRRTFEEARAEIRGILEVKG